MMNPIGSRNLGLWPTHPYDDVAEVAGLYAMIRNVIETAAGLAVGGRRVDVSGLDRTVGLLCAKALDLPPEDGRAARAGLVALLTEIDALSLALRAKSP